MEDILLLKLSNRLFMYAYTCRAFALEPDESFLGIIFESHTLEECSILDPEGGSSSIQQSIQAAVSDSGLEKLKDDYAKTMLMPGKFYVSPWESAHLGDGGLLFQKSTLLVREAFQQAGYVAAGYPKEADDHIAIELNFVEELARSSFKKLETENVLDNILFAQQLDFLENHLLKWVPSLRDAYLEAVGPKNFYTLFAELVVKLCTIDRDFLKSCLD